MISYTYDALIALMSTTALVGSGYPVRRGLDDEEQEQLEKIASGMDGLSAALLNGTEALGRILSQAADHDDGPGKEDVFNLGWLLSVISEVTQAALFIEGEVSARLREAQEAEGSQGKAKATADLQEAQKPAEAPREPGTSTSPPGPDLKDEFRAVHQGLIRLSNDLGILAAYHEDKLPGQYIDGRQLARMFATEGYEASGKVLEDLDRLMDKAGICSLYDEPLDSEEAA